MVPKSRWPALDWPTLAVVILHGISGVVVAASVMVLRVATFDVGLRVVPILLLSFPWGNIGILRAMVTVIGSGALSRRSSWLVAITPAGVWVPPSVVSSVVSFPLLAASLVIPGAAVLVPPTVVPVPSLSASSTIPARTRRAGNGGRRRVPTVVLVRSVSICSQALALATHVSSIATVMVMFADLSEHRWERARLAEQSSSHLRRTRRHDPSGMRLEHFLLVKECFLGARRDHVRPMHPLDFMDVLIPVVIFQFWPVRVGAAAASTGLVVLRSGCREEA